ncbi:KDO2-lipid IV(A) lauroyltransferase [Motilibacter peucedani]|uniref:KDO2-lipid IV(A) lauroyltransferase n=1 Tax=Motilibacter peucedani TaxID=598650 RepID=A0A420XSD0_9ACTN|nr:phosphatidylinositol mannoside acyltransferase [Motilibacter peucedani]RKS77721.1 KDO2-lipid IV(A) lauroyltransferase [Motilibacter peucedani]
MPPLRERAALAAYSLGWAVTRRAPERAAYAVFDVVADLATRRGGKGVERLRAHLARARPDAGPAELDALTRAAMRSYLRYWCDAFRLPGWDRARVLDRVVAVNQDFFVDAMRSGGGFVGALPHMGNWDHAGAWACAVGGPVASVAERLRPEELFERFVAYRERLGLRILPLTGGGNVVAELRTWLRAGNGVCLLCDRDLTASGVEVTLLGEPARLAPGPALLALQTGAPLHPITVAYAPGARAGAHGIVITFHPEVPVPATGTTREKVTAMTQGVADAFSAAIRERPEDWHMLQRVFSADAP